jgi:hypothetical protein
VCVRCVHTLLGCDQLSVLLNPNAFGSNGNVPCSAVSYFWRLHRHYALLHDHVAEEFNGVRQHIMYSSVAPACHVSLLKTHITIERAYGRFELPRPNDRIGMVENDRNVGSGTRLSKQQVRQKKKCDCQECEHFPKSNSEGGIRAVERKFASTFSEVNLCMMLD